MRVKQAVTKAVILATFLALLALGTVADPTAYAKCDAMPERAVTAVTTNKAKKQGGDMVWIPTHGGKKYHKNPKCSNMEDPEKVTLAEAKAQKFTACKKCYK